MNGDGAVPMASEPLTLAQLLDVFMQKEHFDRVLAEKDKKTEADRAALERGLNEAKVTTDKALADAKTAADERGLVLQARIEKLESGGAPFADRLNDQTKILMEDVATLKTNAVRIETLDKERETQASELKAAKQSIRKIAYAAGASLLVSLIIAALSVVAR